MGTAGRAVVWATLAAGILMWLLVGPMTKVPLWGDEGQHLNGARHVLLSRDRWFRPVFDPSDSGGWTAAEVENCHFPPALISIYAVSMAVLGSGSVAMGAPVFLAHLIAGAGLYFLCRRLFGTPTASLAVILWIWAPVGFRRGSQIMAEPFLVALGVAALALIAESMHRRSRLLASAGGVCLGLAFLMKLWMVGPFVLMALGMLLGGQRGERLRLVAPMLAGGLAAGGLHLGIIALVAPDLVSTWTTIYFDLVLSRLHPVAHSKASVGPIWHYLPILYRDYWPLILPLAAFVGGLVHRRSPSWRDRVARNLFVGAVAGLVILSIYESKTPLYVYFLAPVLTLSAARGLALAAEAQAAADPSTRRWLGVALIGFLLMGVAAWAGWARGQWPAVLTTWFCVSHALAAVWLLVFILRESRLRSASVMIGLLVVPIAVGVVTGIETVRAHRADPVGTVAEFIAAHDGPRRPQGVRFVSPRWHALGFRLWQQGRPWAVDKHESLESDTLAPLASGDIEFVEIDREYQARSGSLPDAKAHQSVMTWLREHAVDVTPEIEQASGRRLNTCVFVSKNSTAAADAVAIAPAAKTMSHETTNHNQARNRE
jgi:4-amino-4-deoxy-L-arabinose transferase-like glycosyltransferase